MQDGLYEELITGRLEAVLQGLDTGQISRGLVDPADQPHVLARHLYEVAQRVLSATRDPEERVAIVNDSWPSSAPPGTT